MIHITTPAWNAMIGHLESAYPEEGCGILLGSAAGDDRTAVAASPCGNVHPDDRANRFLIDVVDHIEAQKQARTLGLEIVGFYHSHPDCAAYFSASDKQAASPFASNVVVSMVKGRFEAAASFRLSEDGAGFNQERIEYPPRS